MDMDLDLDMNLDTETEPDITTDTAPGSPPVIPFMRRAPRPPADPAADFVANVVSLLKARLGLEKAGAIARAMLGTIAQAQGAAPAEPPPDLAGLSAEDRLSIKIWLLDLAGQCAEKMRDRKLRDAYEAATRTSISLRLGL
jgi:hypothetical protein